MLVLNAVTFILFVLLLLLFLTGPFPPAEGQPQDWTPMRYGCSLLWLLTLIAFLAHLFGHFA